MNERRSKPTAILVLLGLSLVGNCVQVRCANRGNHYTSQESAEYWRAAYMDLVDHPPKCGQCGPSYYADFKWCDEQLNVFAHEYEMVQTLDPHPPPP